MQWFCKSNGILGWLFLAQKCNIDGRFFSNLCLYIWWMFILPRIGFNLKFSRWNIFQLLLCWTKYLAKKYANQAKLDKANKLWYLFLCKFWRLVQKLISANYTRHCTVFLHSHKIFLLLSDFQVISRSPAGEATRINFILY